MTAVQCSAVPVSVVPVSAVPESWLGGLYIQCSLVINYICVTSQICGCNLQQWCINEQTGRYPYFVGPGWKLERVLVSVRMPDSGMVEIA